MKKILYLFLILLAFSFIILTILLTFNESLRRSVLNKPFSVYNLYNEYLVKVAIEKKDFDRASDIILKHLEISQKFYPGKNKMLGIVMKNINYVSSKAITQNNFNSLENIYNKIYEIDPKIYLNLVYLARAVSDDKPEESKIYLDEAIRISPVSEEAYREMLRIFSKYGKKLEFIEKYCLEFQKSKFGGLTDYHYKKIFDGNSSSIGFYLNDNEVEIYRNFFKKLNEYDEFIFYLKNKKQDVLSFNIVGNFIKGSRLKIKNIYLNSNLENKINLNKLKIVSNKSYILKQNKDEIEIIIVENENNLIKFIFNSPKQNLERFSITLKLTKLPISSDSVCD
tara:strand:- start:1672 stop:2685 length:1014 start_codon:yes stop_codon:yes gene_type:complete